MWERWARGGLLALSAFLASLLVYLLATRVESVPPTGLAVSEAFPRSDPGPQHFTFVQSRAGTVQWEVRAQQAQLLEAKHQALLEEVHVTLFGPTGWQMRLAGDQGALDTARKDFSIAKRDGQIAVELNSGHTIYTNHITWTDERREIRTDDPVRIVGDGLEITGRGLIGRIDGEEFQLLEDVNVRLAP